MLRRESSEGLTGRAFQTDGPRHVLHYTTF